MDSPEGGFVVWLRVRALGFREPKGNCALCLFRAGERLKERPLWAIADRTIPINLLQTLRAVVPPPRRGTQVVGHPV
jgi:hypothetical protein